MMKAGRQRPAFYVLPARNNGRNARHAYHEH